jgi:phosphohistidine phosphatase
MSRKILYIVRHAKSSWDSEGLADIDRPLKEKGVNDALMMSLKAKQLGCIPDLIISSDAIRALHTAVIFARTMGIYRERFLLDHDLYAAGTADILGVLSNIPDSVNSAMIFGHNPGFTEIVNTLSGMNLDNLPTTGFARLVFNAGTWKKICLENIIDHSVDFPAANRKDNTDKV